MFFWAGTPVDGRSGRVEYFDIIRGLAILAVVVVHSGQQARIISGEKELWFKPASDLGMYGVELFFFISGALIVSLYGLGKTQSLASMSYWPKRFARIMPLWIVFFLIFTGLVMFGPYADDVRIFLGEHPGAGGWILLVAAALTFTAWLSPALWNSAVPGGWSIQAEMAHYLTFALMRRLRLRTILIVLVSMNALTLVLIRGQEALPGWTSQPIDAWLRLGFYSTFFYFVLGVVAYVIVSEYKNGHKVSEIAKGLTRLEWVLAVVYVATVLALPLPVNHGNNLVALIFVFGALAIGFVLQKIRWIVPSFTVLGKYSYFLYFMHFVVILGLTNLLTPMKKPDGSLLLSGSFVFALYLAVIFIICLPAAWLSYRYFEKPILQLARRKASPKPRKTFS